MKQKHNFIFLKMYLSKTNYLNFITSNAKKKKNNDECYRWAAIIKKIGP